MDFIDVKYINILSTRLLKFKKVKKDLYNFRCPICGDSQKNKNRTRGYIYSVKNNSNYKCHNCGISITLNNLIKEIDPVLHKEYTLEKFKSGHSGRGSTVSEPKFVFEKPKFNASIFLPLCSEVESARTYLCNRKIDPTKFYYAEDFSEFVKTFKKPEYKDLRNEPRIIIPLYKEKELVGFQGRALNSNSIKYITIMLLEEAPKIYGLDKVKKDETVYVTEGPFDSTFIRNSIALCGADGDVSKWGISDCVWIYDNEPRNAEIAKRISKHIERGEKVVIWPNTISQKDINDMVLSGLDVQSVIESNIYSGLEAKLKFTTWKKYEQRN
jgi:transcription elongation factor Elf1